MGGSARVGRVTRQTVTAFVAAALFVALAVLLVVIPVPFVTWSPGTARNVLGEVDAEPIISVSGLPTYPTTGQLDLTVVSTTAAGSRLSLPQALLAYWLPGRDALPRESVYAPGKSASQVADEDTEMMETAQDDAVVAALRADGQPVREAPAVFSVTVGGPAYKRLLPGDLILAIDGQPTPTREDVGTTIRAAKVGAQLTFSVLRNKSETAVTVLTASSATQTGAAVVGITVGDGFIYAPTISFDLGRKIGGPSAGMIFALAIYDKITPGPLLDGRHVAGTGTIAPSGQVGPIGGIQEKIRGAQAAGATTFLVPARNCADLVGVRTSMRLVKVATLQDAIEAVSALDSTAVADSLPHC